MRLLLLILSLSLPLLFFGCGSADQTLYVQDIVSNAAAYNGQEITVDGAYVWRPGDPGMSVLALGVSTLDSGLDAQPLGDPIWVENFPAEVTGNLHRPGDSVYGFVRVTGRFESGGTYGPDGQYTHRLEIIRAEPIEQVHYIEHRLRDQPLDDGKVSFFELQRNPAAYDGQTITTQGYYFWNSIIWVLAEGVATEESGSSPQPLGDPIWMEGFPPDLSAQLIQGPNNSYVWGLVEVTGRFQSRGGHGKDGQYNQILFVESAVVLEQPN